MQLKAYSNTRAKCAMESWIASCFMAMRYDYAQF
jgi:hypothetical protein